MSPVLYKVLPPYKNRGQRIAVTTTGVTTQLTAFDTATSVGITGMGWVRVRARMASGTGVQFYFTSNGSDSCVFDATDSTAGWSLPSGVAEDFFLSGKETHIAWDADGNGFIDIWRLTQERTGIR